MIFARPTRRERRAYDRLRRRTTVNGRHSTAARPEAHSWAFGRAAPLRPGISAVLRRPSCNGCLSRDPFMGLWPRSGSSARRLRRVLRAGHFLSSFSPPSRGPFMGLTPRSGSSARRLRRVVRAGYFLSPFPPPSRGPFMGLLAVAGFSPFYVQRPPAPRPIHGPLAAQRLFGPAFTPGSTGRKLSFPLFPTQPRPIYGPSRCCELQPLLRSMAASPEAHSWAFGRAAALRPGVYAGFCGPETFFPPFPHSTEAHSWAFSLLRASAPLLKPHGSHDVQKLL